MNFRHFSFFRCCYASFALLLAILGFAWTPVHAIEPATTCEVRLWFDADFSNPSDPNNAGGNPPPGTKIIGTGMIAEPIFTGPGASISSGSTLLGGATALRVFDLDEYQMRVDDMNFLDGGDWEGFAENVSSIQFRHYDQPNEVWVPGCKGWTAIFYDDKSMQGASIAVTGSLKNLGDIGWNDRAASFELYGPANLSAYSPPASCTVELYEHTLSGDTWGASSHLTPQTFSASQGAGMISSIRFGGECGTTSVTLFDGGNSIAFTNADSDFFHLGEFGWEDRATSWTANFNVATDPSPRGCILRLFDGSDYTGQSWAVAGSQTTGSITGSQGAGVISSLAFEGDCGDSEVIFDDGNGNQAYVRAADGAQHPLWLSDWDNRAQSWTANFVGGSPTPTDPNLPVPTYVPCEVRLYDGIYTGQMWSANTDQATNNKFSSNQGAGSISSVEFRGAWCHDTYLELYDVDPAQHSNALPYIVKVADGARRDVAALGFDNKTQFWRVNFSDQPATPSVVPDVVDMLSGDAEGVLKRMFYTPVKDRDWIMGVDVQGNDQTVHDKVLWTSYPSGAQLDAGTQLPPGSVVHYTRIIHPQGPPPPGPPPPPITIASFATYPGQAIDIGAGNGPVWMLDLNGGANYQFLSAWKHRPGVSGTRLTYGGWTYVVDTAGDIVIWNPEQGWVSDPPGAIPAQDVGYGYGDWGNVWIVGSNPPYDIQRLVVKLPLQPWETPISVPGGAKRVDVDLHGNPWIVNQSGQIYRHLVGGWEALPGFARDIGCGRNGDVWIVGTNPVSGGYEIFRWREDLFDWELVSNIAGVAISVGVLGDPYVVADDGTIYEGTMNIPTPSKPPKSHPPVPSVAGMTTASAISAIQNAGYVVVHSNTIKTTDSNLSNTVESITPTGGTPLAPGRTVSYVDYQEVIYQFLGGNPIHVKLGDSFSDPGLNEVLSDGTILQTISGDVSGVNTGVVGQYTVPYVITEADGSTVTVAELIVNVYDYIAPVITLNGSSPMDITREEQFIDPSGTAIDDVDGAVNVVVEEILFSPPDYMTVPGYTGTIVSTVGTSEGEYTLTYAATDAAGNKATATRLVRRSALVNPGPVTPGGGGGPVVVDPGVGGDTRPPTITLFGASEIDVAYGAAFTDPGAEAVDDVDGIVTVNVSGQVNIVAPGDYTLTYTAIDAARNTATATRRVRVLAEPSAEFTTSWTQIPSGITALDIGAGANGSVWMVGSDHRVYRLADDNSGWIDMGLDGAARIDVTLHGNGLVVKHDQQVWHYEGHNQKWVHMPGLFAIDVGTGADGSVWALGNPSGISNAGSVYQLNFGTGIWEERGIAGTRIDVAPNGRAYIVQSDGTIVQYGDSPGVWHVTAGGLLATDVALGISPHGAAWGAIWAVGPNDEIYRWSDVRFSNTGNGWEKTNGGSISITSDDEGNVLSLAHDGSIWQGNSPDSQ